MTFKIKRKKLKEKNSFVVDKNKEINLKIDFLEGVYLYRFKDRGVKSWKGKELLTGKPIKRIQKGRGFNVPTSKMPTLNYDLETIKLYKSKKK